MGRFRALAPFLLAVLVALGATVFIYRWLQTKVSQPVVTAPSEDRINLAYAGLDLAWGTKLTPEMIKIVAIPKNVAPSGHFTDSAALVGRVLIYPVKQNEAITESKLAPVSVTTGGVCAVIAPGKRAIAVAGDKVIGLSGFIQPGNFVDILATLKLPESEREYVTKVVLEDVLVLATGNQMQNSADGKPAPVDVFTIQVSPEEAERLSLAATNGKLHFALRNTTDREVVYTLGTTISDALDAYRPRMKPIQEDLPTRTVSGEPRSKPMEKSRQAYEVQTIKGSKVGKETF